MKYLYSLFDKEFYKLLKNRNNVIIWWPDYGPWHIGHWYYLNLLKEIQNIFKTKIYFFIDFTNLQNFHNKKELTYFKLKEYIEFSSNIVKFENLKDLDLLHIKKVQNKYARDPKTSFFKRNVLTKVFKNLLYFSKRYKLENKIKYFCTDQELYSILKKIIINLNDRSIKFIETEKIPLSYSRRNLDKTFLEFNPIAIKNLKKFKKFIKGIENEKNENKSTIK